MMKPIAAMSLCALLVLSACSGGNDDDDTASAVCPGAELGKTPAFEETSVFVANIDGYNVYRIPSLAVTKEGTLLAVAEGRPSIEDPGSGEIDLVAKRSTDCGRTWSDLTVLADNGSDDAHNPVTIVQETEEGSVIWLVYGTRPASHGGEFDLPTGLGLDSAQVWVISSADQGQTWNEPQNITTDVKDPDWAILSPGPGAGIVTHRGPAPGRLIAPAWYWADGGLRGSVVLYSDDDGVSWQRGGVTVESSEPQAIELADGTVLLDARQVEGPTRKHFRSDDAGLSFSAPTDGLPMTPVMASIVRYPDADGQTLLHSGPAPDNRVALRIWTSDDEAATWTERRIIQPNMAQYSQLAILGDRTIGLLYETISTDKPPLGLSIRFVRFNLAYLLEE